MKQYKASVDLPRNKFWQIQDLLDIEDFDDMDADGPYIERNYFEEVFTTSFKDGSAFTYCLCSNENRYYDDMFWTGAEETINFEPDHDLGKRIEFFANRAHYIIDIKVI